ncbi:hypothetical protein Tco_0894523 [Tanacetum coccineum]|uniref:Uncharacterized protein n=1 Tax=Tanacetum coccineum TaxID=301880 RepID=A0ABQ5CF91_9ASTR
MIVSTTMRLHATRSGGFGFPRGMRTLHRDHQRQVQLSKALKLLKGLQTQMVVFQRQLGPAKGPAQPNAPGEAGSSS